MVAGMAGMRGGYAFACWLLIAALVVALDQWTKGLASNSLTLYRPVELTGWLNLTLAHNTGAAFSLLSDASGWQRWFFVAIAVVVGALVMAWLWRTARHEWPQALALSLVLGGAVGNVADRLRLGYVVDFIDVHAGGWHWPAFNIADSAISVGVVVLLLDAFLVAKARPDSGG